MQRDILTLFLRDKEICQSCAIKLPKRPGQLISEIYCKCLGESLADGYPESIFPFHGLAWFTAPICYLFPSAECAYPVFKEMYER